MQLKIFTAFAVFSCLFLLPRASFSGDWSDSHWVDDNGTESTWSNCESSSEMSGASACTLATANANATAGDTVNIRAGTYNTAIAPTNSGTLGNRITWYSYDGPWAAKITGSGLAWGIDLRGVDYHSIDGIEVYETQRLMQITNGSDYNEIRNTKIHENLATSNAGIELRTCSATQATGNTHNWIHDNVWYAGGYFWKTGGCDDDAGLFTIGITRACGNPGNDEWSNYNTIENNIFYWGSHHVWRIYSRFNVFRNNVYRNDGGATNTGNFDAVDYCRYDYTNGLNGCASSTGRCCNPPYDDCSGNGYWGNRGGSIIAETGTTPEKYNLMEGNRGGYGRTSSDGNAEGGITLNSSRNIVRYNAYFDWWEGGIYLRHSGVGDHENTIYNNTIYHGGYLMASARTNGTKDDGLHAVNSTNVHSNYIVNNIVYDSYADDIRDMGQRNTYRANMCDTSSPSGYCANGGDPLFVNPDISTPSSMATLPDLSLQTGSTARDAGSWLTQANGSGSDSTNLAVDNVLYFQDGSWGSSLSDVQADWICITSSSTTVTYDRCVQINSLSYTGAPGSSPDGIITLASPLSWSDNDYIWLYRKSDGEIVLHGTRPDQGAYEYGSGSGDTTPPNPPQNLRIVP